jgi:nucleoside-diphosphate-sugar epimerase
MAKQLRVVVTGGRGFIGRSLVSALQAKNLDVLSVVRANSASQEHKPFEACIDRLDGSTNWLMVLEGADVVVHLAARAHIMQDEALDPLAAYRSTNTQGTLNLAFQAAQMGVRRFVFVSTLKVNGEQSVQGQPFRFDDVPNPQDPYGQSKYEAELGLRKIASDTGMEVVIVRPPLVYGAGVKGNFASLFRWVTKERPLPLAGVVGNKRSLVGLDNLIDLLATCVSHVSAANQTFLVSDGEDLSTAELLSRLGCAMGKRARLLYVPPSWLSFLASLLGKGAVAQRLLGNLQVDITHTCETLGWRPPVSVDEGLRRTVQNARNDVSENGLI